MNIKFLDTVNGVVWGVPTLFLILFVGIYLSFSTGFSQIRMLPSALKSFACKFKFRQGRDSGISPFQALCTALAATVGTGNLAGVAGAIAIGGPGAVFWMWVCAFFGMVTKFAEVSLAVHFRSKSASGEFMGGPMYMIQNGLHRRWRWLAFVYCFFGVVASFGVGNATQINAVLGSVNSVIRTYGGESSITINLAIGSALGLLILKLLLGGAKRIGRATQFLIPAVSLLYILLASGSIAFNINAIPGALKSIVVGAFDPKAVTGGLLGSTFVAMRVGASRGVFTNEAGMGTASIAHASSNVKHPIEQGLLGIVEVFLDTIVICTLTALVILVSGCHIPYGTDAGITLTTDAFALVYGPWVRIPIMISLCCFAIGTVMGWGLYGIRCAQYMFGDMAVKPFIYCQAAIVVLSAFLSTGTIWTISEILNGMMAVPNLIAVLLLSPVLRKLYKQYKQIS